MPDAAPPCSDVCFGSTSIAVRGALVCGVEASLDGRHTLVGDRFTTTFGPNPEVVGAITTLGRTLTHPVSSDEAIGKSVAVAFGSDLDLNATNAPVFRATPCTVTTAVHLVTSDALIFTSDAHLGAPEASVASGIRPHDPLKRP